MRWIAALVLSATIACADGDAAGEFDYYVLSLSWSPSFCKVEGAAKGNPQCRESSGYGWVLHGLWPQYETGWPSYCRTVRRNPSRSETAAMADIMGSPGSAWHQWKKHGRCSGLSPEAYFSLARRAYASVKRPEILRQLDRPVTLPARVVEEAFLQSNPGWRPDMITITCKAGRIQEARLCLTRELEPRRCGEDVSRDCAVQDALLDPVR